MDIRKNYINFVALDGFRMAIQKLEKETGIENSVIIPSRSLNELVKIIDDENEITLNISRNNIVFKFDDTVFYSTLLSGEFFSYKALLRDEHKISTNVSKKEFQLAVERASLLAREDRANLIKLNIRDKYIDIKSNSEIDGVKILESEEITLNFTDSVNPLIITESDDDSYIYLVLPVRLAG